MIVFSNIDIYYENQESKTRTLSIILCFL